MSPSSFLIAIGEWSRFTVSATIAAVAAVPRPGRWVRPLYGVLVGGLPLAVVLGVALGAVVWMHTRGIASRAGEMLPAVLAAAVLLELAPVGAGLIAAARTGASLGAELASMKLAEQIDALELLGVPPVRRLVGPRVLACVIAVPLLHILVAVLALGSMFAAEATSGNTTWLKYQTDMLRELRIEEVVPAGLKTLAFGALIGITGCFVGLRASGGSEGVGKAATNSVVVCSLLVLAADVFLVGLFRAIL
jgi:phospholipid/cholesterol/gamma-HCH transport system permease protein